MNSEEIVQKFTEMMRRGRCVNTPTRKAEHEVQS